MTLTNHPYPTEIPLSMWARWPWQQCKARTADGSRCDLKKHGYMIDHALERGMDTPRWTTQWTA